MAAITFLQNDVKKVSELASIPLTQQETEKLADGFTQTMKVVDTLSTVTVANVEPTSQVTGLENVFREDTIDTTHMLSQQEALANAKHTHNGYFVVSRVLDQTIDP